MEDLETSAALAFHGVEYVVTVGVERQELLLQVEVEDAAAGVASSGGNGNGNGHHAATGSSAGDCWTARFPAAYIEELTRKTGNYKRFPVFVSMLLSALAHRSDAVFIDLLTAADLELYRKRKMGKAGGGSSSDAFGGLSMPGNGSGGSNKRYLILTYAVEFDRVHYPLPLALVQTPTPDVLQRTIRRLRQALATRIADPHGERQLADENAALREENRCLKSTLKQYYGAGGGAADAENADPTSNHDKLYLRKDPSSIDLQRELEASIEENKELLGIYQHYREETTQEMARLKAEIRQLKAPKATDEDVDRASLAGLSQALEQERLDARRKLKESSDTIEETLEEMVKMKAQLEGTQLKNRELMRQVAILRAKAGDQSDTVSSSPSGRRGVGAPTRRPANATQQRFPQSRTTPTRGRGALPGGLLQQQARKPSSFGYRSSDDERESNHSSTEGRSKYNPPRQTQQQRRVFRRFDPTAYQLDKERKQQQQRSRSPAPRNAPGRRNPSMNGGGGYASDSSAGGGYSSADSRGSNASSRSTQSRGRLSAQRQREIDARLASPKRALAAETARLPPRFRSPMTRPQAMTSPPMHGRSTSRGRSPSSARSVDAARSVKRSASPAPSAASVGRGQSSWSRKGATASRNRKGDGGSDVVGRDASSANMARDGSPVTHPVNASVGPQRRRQQQQNLQQKQRALLMDTSMDSFSDIDDRLTALQQFLKEAKQGTGGGGGASTTRPGASTSNAPSPRRPRD